ncbi:D-amino acid dehydrogenase [Stakelama pacifica]|uniref:D-amino acid dehydrogenase n=1 Tax=Stakelama pacifica TaxID=517720 RepID=A0A4R6FB67_9SPHN|nr:D-amino acid dehydrogenase [Stakelama pacifica]TDN78257.1 D-amino acid dehydrogenase small subunit [Stakelama pacifica]GGO99785.1 D-amino acid dehydrogenase [Stakelama pacifica]
MRIIVLGAGVIGTSTAYYLAEEGHEVVVLDRQPGPALETSFANAGEISPGYAAPWATPNTPWKALGWLFTKHAPLVWRPKADPDMVRWLWTMLANCGEAKYLENKARLLRLAEFSRDELRLLRQRTGIQYDQRTEGTLQLFRDAAQMESIAKDVKVLEADGVPYQVLDRAGCIAVEPGLANATVPVAGGLRLPNDETGDCFKFSNELAAIAERSGVEFRYNETIERIDRDGALVSGVLTDRGMVRGDAYVLALGSYSPLLVKRLGLRLPIYPIKGYSLTLPIVDPDNAPQSTVIDDAYKVAVTRLGDRIRVAGTAEISGYDKQLPPNRRETLELVVKGLYPRAGDLAAAAFWSGLRPMTPDTTPIVGSTPISNLFTNTGHGTYGWTMACGSGRILADVIAGRPSAIRTEDLGIGRYH